MLPLLPTTLVGSYAQPDWLIDREKLGKRFPPRVRAKELWRVAPEWLEQAQDDATIIAIRDQERAGLDIITDGEMRRESYSNRFATALDGVDIDNPGTALDRSGHPNPVPRVVGPIKRRHPVQVRDVKFLRANTDRPIKITVPGPFTMSQQVQDDYYKDEVALALDYAAAVNAEIKDLFAAGADIVQVDEPYMQARVEKAKVFGVKVLDRALDGVTGTTAVHICFGYAAVIHNRPSAYSFLPEYESSKVQQISIETAQAVSAARRGARKNAGYGRRRSHCPEGVVSIRREGFQFTLGTSAAPSSCPWLSLPHGLAASRAPCCQQAARSPHRSSGQGCASHASLLHGASSPESSKSSNGGRTRQVSTRFAPVSPP
jgi:5-methyltetrahydropteroyltriglutamate--homocysteine methyltransferase